MGSIARRFGGSEPVPRFNPMFGQYLFTWVTGEHTQRQDGATFTNEVFSQAALTGLFRRAQLERESGRALPGTLAAFLREQLPDQGQVLAEGPGDFAAWFPDENLMHVACGDVLIELAAETDINDLDRPGNPQGREVAAALTGEIIGNCR